MIDVRTLEFMKILDNLAAQTEYGIKDKQDFASPKERCEFEGVIYENYHGKNMVLTGDHMGSHYEGHDFKMEVQLEEECEPTIIVSFPNNDELIAVHDGCWYVIQ